jgi:hypothetical protein
MKHFPRAVERALPTTRRSGPLRAVCFAAATAALATGCGGSDVPRLGDSLQEIEFNEPLDSAAYVPLGKFDVPAATRIKREGATRTLWLRLNFELLAETSPRNESAVTAAAERHRGALNDAVLTIIRTSSTDELTDPRLSALKLRMTEAARPMLGEGQMRQLVLIPIRTDVL